MAVAYQEEACYLIDEKKYVEVAKCLEEAGVLFNKLPDSPAKFFNLAANYELLGANNLKLSNTTVAENEFKESDTLPFFLSAKICYSCSIFTPFILFI